MMYGEKLRQLRKLEGWTQEEVAKKIGVTKQTYNHYENENRRPSLDMVRELGRVYQVNLDAIFAGEDDGPLTPDPEKKADEKLLTEIKKIADKHGMDLTDPKTLDMLDGAFDFLRRMQDK